MSTSSTDRAASSLAAVPGRNAAFVTTQWSVVLKAGAGNEAEAEAALARLCQTYWYPLYVYVRQRGYGWHDAQDLTQEFFARLLRRNTLQSVTRDRGRFRSFLLSALNRFLTDEWRKAGAKKRGSRSVVSLDAADAETRFRREPVDRLTPEKLFEHNWALALLNRVYEGLREEFEKSGKGVQFEALKFCLTGDRSKVPYAELAERLGVSENAVKVSVHRMRQRYRELLREEVAHTVAEPGEIEDELRRLFRALSGA